jgi:hypothetical protein
MAIQAVSVHPAALAHERIGCGDSRLHLLGRSGRQQRHPRSRREPGAGVLSADWDCPNPTMINIPCANSQRRLPRRDVASVSSRSEANRTECGYLDDSVPDGDGELAFGRMCGRIRSARDGFEKPAAPRLRRDESSDISPT